MQAPASRDGVVATPPLLLPPLRHTVEQPLADPSRHGLSRAGELLVPRCDPSSTPLDRSWTTGHLEGTD